MHVSPALAERGMPQVRPQAGGHDGGSEVHEDGEAAGAGRERR